jgi:trehalose 6-phosphate synthase
MSSLNTLKLFVQKNFPDARLIIASKSEPYSHIRKADSVHVQKGADGLVAAIDPVMQAVDGVWVAAGLANADFDSTDDKGRIRVPEDLKKYTLRRMRFSDREKVAMTNTGPGGFWPLCHVTFVKPLFDEDDWEVYKKINARIADAIIEEAGDDEAVVWLQDYHLVMCAKYIKEKRPDLTVGLFWHTPWPDWEVFVRHPMAYEVIEGMIANDLLGFHTKYYCNNFIRCCQRTHELVANWDYSIVEKSGKRTKVMDFPISIDYKKYKKRIERLDKDYIEKVRDKYWLRDKIVALSAERFVYTKGIAEKIQAVDKLLQNNPDLIEKFVMLDITAMTGSHSKLPAGKRYHDECIKLMYEVNEKYETSDWKPIKLTASFVNSRALSAL